jgi:5-phospho-D-xylono-1,4-lactonase
VATDEARASITTVLGPARPEVLGVVDAHNHVWIEPVPGAIASGPTLTERGAILAELKEYRRAGGGTILDCQPGGCGRNGTVLAELSEASGVALVACTGFHRRRYYPPDFWLWDATAGQAGEHFIAELRSGLTESQGAQRPVRAGFVKVACEAALADTPRAPLEGAARAAGQTGCALAVHTEQGAAAEEILRYLMSCGVGARQVILCHVDKRPDFGLHRELAQAGALLEYDTFYRPKYDPEANLWPLIERMVAAGLESCVALATDMADPGLWAFGGGPGLAGLPTHIRGRLEALGLPQPAIRKLLGRNVAGRLAGNAVGRGQKYGPCYNTTEMESC